MSSIVEKIVEPNGKVLYRLTIKLANGTQKVENFERAFDAQKRQRQIEEDTRKGVTGNHYA
jgi:predicted transglutaminase-like protease